MATTSYRVCAPYVTCKLLDAAGKETVIGFYEGGILPEYADPENVKILVDKGMVEEFDPGDPPGEAQAPEDPADVEPLAPLHERVEAVRDAEKEDKAEQAKAAKAAEADAADDEVSEVDADVFGPRRPRVNAPKEDWVAYAVAQRDDGVSEVDARADAEAMSKADLIAEHGN